MKMSDRKEAIFKRITDSGGISIPDLCRDFNISKRTLYYDLKKLNTSLSLYGQGIIKNIDQKITYIGESDNCKSRIDDRFYNKKFRRNYLLYKILIDEFKTIDLTAVSLNLSKSTIFSTLQDIKAYLRKYDLHLVYDKKYYIAGSELQIRELFIYYNQHHYDKDFKCLKSVLEFKNQNNLSLSDYTLYSVSSLIIFLKQRIHAGHALKTYKYYNLVKKTSIYNNIDNLLDKKANKYDKAYLTAYILSLTNLKIVDNSKEIIEVICNSIVEKFELCMNIDFESKSDLLKNLKRHLSCSYNRILFGFPIYNPLLKTIKDNYSFFYKITKYVVESLRIDINLRDEDIAYIALYFGVYSNTKYKIHNKAIVVCPNGLVVSKTLEKQIRDNLPQIEIIDNLNIYELKNYSKDYDFIISTIDLPEYKNVILVNPLLNSYDIRKLNKLFYNNSSLNQKINIKLLIKLVEKYANIFDYDNLEKDLANLLITREKDDDSPMLSDLLTRNKIKRLKSVKDYKEAISIASKPLIEDKTITKDYVIEMYKALDKYGPYIVLADHFALPHATSKIGVNKIGMSLLVVENEVDLLGKPVNIFCVLATTDNKNHLKALAELSEILYDKNNIDFIIKASEESIYNLIQKKEKEK